MCLFLTVAATSSSFRVLQPQETLSRHTTCRTAYPTPDIERYDLLVGHMTAIVFNSGPIQIESDRPSHPRSDNPLYCVQVHKRPVRCWVENI